MKVCMMLLNKHGVGNFFLEFRNAIYHNSPNAAQPKSLIRSFVYYDFTKLTYKTLLGF
jgi:hypothetical protein